MIKWIRRWQVTGNSGNLWIVAIDRDGNYGCSCPVWKFHRKECHHIRWVKSNPDNPQLKVEDIRDKEDDFNPFMTRYQMLRKEAK
jgi:hypothetical protein